MSKVILKTLSVAATLAGAGAVSSTIYADEVVSDAQPTIEATNQEAVTVTPEALAEQKEVVSEAKDDVDSAQEAVNKAEATAEQAQNTLDTANINVSTLEKRLETAQEVANEATPEAFEEADTAIATANEKVSATEEALAEAKAAESDQSAIVKEATEKTATEQAKTDSLQKDVDDAKQAINSEELLAAENKASDLRQTVESNSAEVEELEKTLTTKKTEQEELISSGNTARAELEEAVTAAGPEYTTEIVERTILENTVPDSQTKTAPLKSATFTGNDGNTYYSAANEDVTFNGERTETIVLDSAEAMNTPHKVDYKKFSQYVHDYLVELRNINGIDIAVPEVTDKALAWAKARTDEMDTNNVLSHSTTLKVGDYGLLEQTENATTSASDYTTLDEKELAYDLLLRYFNDYANVNRYGSSDPEEANARNYGHRILLLAGSGTGMAVEGTGTYGVLSFVSDDATKDAYNYYDYAAATAENKDDDPLHSEFYYNGKRVTFLPKTTFKYVWNETVRHQNLDYTNAVNELNSFNEEQAKKEVVLASEISEISTDLANSKDTLSNNAQALAAAEKTVEELTADNKEQLEVLRQAQVKLDEQTAVLNDTKDKQAAEEAKLLTLVSDRKALESDLENAKQALKSAEEHKQSLIDAKATVFNLEKALEQAKEDQAKAQDMLTFANKELAKTQTALEEAQAIYQTEKDLYDSMVLAAEKQAEEKRLAELQAKYDQVIKDDGVPVVVYEDGKIVDYINGEQPVISPTIQTIAATQSVVTRRQAKNEAAGYKAKSATLPSTGEGEGFVALAGYSILSALGVTYIGKRKKTEEKVNYLH